MTTPHSPSSVPPIAPDKPWLAPLAGFSDLAFRLLCREYGAAVAVTEMVSAKGLVYGSPGTEPLLATVPEDSPLVVQLFGAEPAFVGRAMDSLLDRGFGWFDLNAGCSVPKVAKTGAGAIILKTPDSLLAVVREMVGRAGRGRVGVKLRLGWDTGRDAFLDVARQLVDEGVGWLALHPRYGRQGFSGRADWDRLAELKAAVPVPVIASGDLLTAGAARECLERTGVDGVMFARGAIHDPAIFMRFLNGSGDMAWTGDHLARLVRRHAELARIHGSGRQALLKMRTVVPGYVRHLAGSRTLRKDLTLCTSWERLDEIIGRIAVLEPATAERE